MQPVNVTIPRPLNAGDMLQVNFTVEIPPDNSIPIGAVGADISKWNVITDWDALANEMSFLFMRATMGATGRDDKFVSNWVAAKAAGVDWLGIYHLFIVGIDPIAQAQNIIRATGGDVGNLPVVLDIEPLTGQVISPTQWPAISADIAALIEECEILFGHTPMIYTSAGAWPLFVGNKLLPPLDGILPRVPLFVADYTGAVSIPLGWDRWAFHQRGKKPRAWATGPIDDDVCSGYNPPAE